MSEIKVNNIQSLSGANGPEISGTVEMNSTGAMSLPRGDTAYRGGRGRGVFGGGYGASSPWPTINTIDYVTIATLGNATDFGDLSVRRSAKCGGSSATRGCFMAGRFPSSPTVVNVIDYIEIQSTGNAFDFGDLTICGLGQNVRGTSNQIRTVYGGGYTQSLSNDWLNGIGYFAIATKGNTSEFGSFNAFGRKIFTGSNGTRGIFANNRGANPGTPGTYQNTIEYVTIASLGNAQDFGDTTAARHAAGSMTSSTRMVMQGGINPSAINTIDYLTMASLGDAIDFGDVDATVRESSASTSSPTRGVFNPGSEGGGTTNNSIHYITIATTGNSSDFGDLSAVRGTDASLSDSHGGLE